MFNYISGKVVEKGVGFVVLDVNGIGYELIVSNNCAAGLDIGSTAKLYAYLSVREDGISLLGFYNKEEKAMFTRLISISGIGPKVAIGILGGLSLNDLTAAIVSGDYKKLSGIKGIGKKTAERIVLELRDNLGREYASVEPAVGGANPSEINEEAILALMALGYNKQEAIGALKKVDTNGKSVEDVILAALKNG